MENVKRFINASNLRQILKVVNDTAERVINLEEINNGLISMNENPMAY